MPQIKKIRILGFLKNFIYHPETSADVVVRGERNVDIDLKKIENSIKELQPIANKLILQNGWQENGDCFYIKVGKMVIVSINCRRGTPDVGTILTSLPYKFNLSNWSNSNQGGVTNVVNGAVKLDKDGKITILTEISNADPAINLTITGFIE